MPIERSTTSFVERIRLWGSRGRIKFVEAEGASDIGLACLAMTLQLHGKYFSIERLRQFIAATPGSSQLERVLEAGHRLGMLPRVVQLNDAADLRHLEAGSVLEWGPNHCVVVERVHAGKVQLVDPIAGASVVTCAHAAATTTGRAVVFERGVQLPNRTNRASPLGGYLRRLASHHALVMRIVALSFVIQLSTLAMPLMIGVVVDRIVPRSDYDLLRVLALGYSIIILLDLLSRISRGYVLLYLNTRLSASMTLECLAQILEMPLAKFRQRGTGDLLERLRSTLAVRELSGEVVTSGFLDGCMAFLFLVVLFICAPLMGVIALTFGFARVAVTLLGTPINRAMMERRLQLEAENTSFLAHVFEGIETVKATGAEKHLFDRWCSMFVDSANAYVKQAQTKLWINVVLSALQFTSPLVILAVGVYQTLDGKLTLGMMIACSSLANQVLFPLTRLSQYWISLQDLAVHLRRIGEVMEEDVDAARPTSREAAGHLLGNIEIDNVSFRYHQNGPLVLDEVSLEIRAGEFVAIIGPSGCGKTTLASLLVGLYAPTSGRILYDGRDVQQLDPSCLRRELGTVRQDTALFEMSVSSNIALFDPSTARVDIELAAKLAHVDADIEAIPGGYDAWLGGDCGLSGGQRQRIGLARALVTSPTVLVLDEPTSALDLKVERQIMKELKRLSCTRVVITHRLDAIREADTIVVMNKGKLVEVGQHSSLVGKTGLYADMIGRE